MYDIHKSIYMETSNKESEVSNMSELRGILFDHQTGLMSECTVDGYGKDGGPCHGYGLFELLAEHNPEMCRMDHLETNFDGKYYDIWFDDEFLYNSETPTAVSPLNRPTILGSCFVCGFDREGRSISLTDEDVAIIKKHTICVKNLVFLDSVIDAEGTEKGYRELLVYV